MTVSRVDALPTSQAVQLIEVDGQPSVQTPIGTFVLSEVPQLFDGPTFDQHTHLIPHVVRLYVDNYPDGRPSAAVMVPIFRYFAAMDAVTWIVGTFGGAVWRYRGQAIPVTMNMLRFCLTSQVEVSLTPMPDPMAGRERAGVIYGALSDGNGLTDQGKALISDWFTAAIDGYLSHHAHGGGDENGI